MTPDPSVLDDLAPSVGAGPRGELLDRVRNGHWIREDLLETTSTTTDYSRDDLEDALDSLLAGGEVYEVPTDDGQEVRRT